jgi:choline-glycine betaine transporter
MIVIILLGTYGGIKLDEKYPNEYSIFTVICSLLSVGIAMYFVIKQVTDFSKKEDKEK